MLRGLFLLLAAWAAPCAAEQVLRRGNQVEPESLDPHRATGISAAHILRDLFEGLTREAADGRIEPGVAASWELSADGLRYRFHLRPDARWSNGAPLTADHFVFALQRSVDPATASSYAQMLRPIENAQAITAGTLPPQALGVRALGAHELEIRLAGPTPYLPGLLTHASTYPLYPPNVAEFGEHFARPGQLVSNGAYQLQEWVSQSHLRLQRNPAYWDAAAVTIDSVIYYPIDNLSAEFKRYRAGELDWTSDIPVTQVRWIREHLGGEYHTGPYLGMYYFGFNVARAPFAGQPGLRRALNLVIDRETLAREIIGAGEVAAYSWVPPGVWNYTPQTFDWASWPMDRRIAEAQRLYRQAGYGPHKPLQIEIRYNTQQDHRRVSIVLAWMWKQALGVETRLINEEWKVFLQNRRHRKLTQVFRASWIGDYDDASNFAEVMQSGSGFNDYGYANPDYDALLARAAAQPDPVQRRALLEQAERVLLQDAPVIPLYPYISRRLIKPYVRGWATNIMDHHPTRNLRIDAH